MGTHAHVGGACCPVSSGALSMHATHGILLTPPSARGTAKYGSRVEHSSRLAVCLARERRRGRGAGQPSPVVDGGEIRFRDRLLELGMASHMTQYGKCQFVSVAKIERPLSAQLSRLDRGTAVPPPPNRPSERLHRNEEPHSLGWTPMVSGLGPFGCSGTVPKIISGY